MMLYLFLGLKVDQQKPEMSGKARRNQVNCISIQFLLYFQVFFFIINSTKQKLSKKFLMD